MREAATGLQETISSIVSVGTITGRTWISPVILGRAGKSCGQDLCCHENSVLSQQLLRLLFYLWENWYTVYKHTCSLWEEVSFVSCISMLKNLGN